jgi:hypothetical protein
VCCSSWQVHAALLLHWPGDREEQQRLKARVCHRCLQYNLRRCWEGLVGVEVVVGHVQQRAKKVLACLPKQQGIEIALVLCN